MQLNWNTVVITQLFVWLIVLFEWKHLSNTSKADRLTFAALLVISTLMSFFTLINLPGPITLIRYIFGPFSKML